MNACAHACMHACMHVQNYIHPLPKEGLHRNQETTLLFSRHQNLWVQAVQNKSSGMGEPIEAGRCETRRRRLFAVERAGLLESRLSRQSVLCRAYCRGLDYQNRVLVRNDGGSYFGFYITYLNISA